MTWLARRQRTREAEEPPQPESVEAGPASRSSPGLAALFDALHADGRHSILDLGAANGRNLRLLGRFGRIVRFANLIPRAPDDTEWMDALRSLPPHRERPYDVVLVWDLLDRLGPAERRGVIDHMAEITARGARLYAVIDASGAVTTRPVSFSLVDVNRVTEVAVGPPEPSLGPILPAQVERDLAPFKIAHAFTLRGGLREYVALKAT